VPILGHPRTRNRRRLPTVIPARRLPRPLGGRPVRPVLPNWERGYQAALRALSEPIRINHLLRIAADTVKHDTVAVQAARDQFQVALLAKAEAGALRYVSVLAERRPDRVAVSNFG
jgi:hypothetical protein